MTQKRPYIRSEQRQADTIEAVVHLCGEQNPATLTTATIAKQINLTQGALFKHFPNKSSLWEAVAHWVARQLIEKIASVASQHSSAIQALEAMFLTHVDFIARHPGVPRLMLGELQKPEQTRAKTIIKQALANYRQRIELLLDDGIKQAEIRSDLDKGAAAALYLGAIQGLVVQALISGEMATANDAAPRVFNLYHQGIKEAGQ